MGVSKLHINCTGDNSMRDSVPEMKERVPCPCPVIRTGFCCPWRSLYPEQLSGAQKARLFPGTASDTHPARFSSPPEKIPGRPLSPSPPKPAGNISSQRSWPERRQISRAAGRNCQTTSWYGTAAGSWSRRRRTRAAPVHVAVIPRPTTAGHKPGSSAWHVVLRKTPTSLGR